MATNEPSVSTEEAIPLYNTKVKDISWEEIVQKTNKELKDEDE